MKDVCTSRNGNGTTNLAENITPPALSDLCQKCRFGYLGPCCGWPHLQVNEPDIIQAGWDHHGLHVGGPKRLILAAALTGAKFTPQNHRGAISAIVDSILRGERIPVELEVLLAEVAALQQGGVRYVHWHARNPATREQSSELQLYRDFGLAVRRQHPGLAISFGASRNGPEVLNAIATHGEWTRIGHAALPLHEGGADFVTSHAAAELIAILDLERQGYIQVRTDGSWEFLRSLNDYNPTEVAETVAIEANSTSGGSVYGSSSPAEQLRMLSHTLAARNRLNLPQEVEWTQLPRSYLLTRLLMDPFKPTLGGTGRLNLTILFGFSPKLPFPTTYEAFRRVVALARSLEQRATFPAMHLTTTVSAAILPQKAAELVLPLDVGPYRGEPVSPLERMVAYACQPNSDVDVLRFGLEDHPFLLDDQRSILPVTNLELMEFVLEKVEKHEGQIITDPTAIRHFVSAEGRPYLA